MSIDVAPRWIFSATDRGLRSVHANLGHEVVPDLAFDRQRRFEVDVFAVRRKSASSSGVTSPLFACDSASAIQTARHSLRRSCSENSSRSSGRP